MIKAVIVDDELDAIESVKLLLNENFSNITIVGTAQSVADAECVINSSNPDIVFLDIEMPDGNGFDVLERIPNRNFSVIFITAYNQYAIKAFKYSAIDYILKPIDITDFLNAVGKYSENVLHSPQVEDKIDVLLENINGKKPEKIALSTSESIEFVKITDIIQIEAEGSYSTLKFIDQTELVVSKNLGEFESLLEDHPFYRPHQSHLINLQHVKKVTRMGNEIVMDDGSIAFLSRRKKNQFMELMSTLVQHKK
ncbi:MAG: LytTR family DNA-binding domain-containing protein [Salinivirgaceae bacterium]|jgi:two-component system LytT family response regulator|nr:LytTR family DNA-binding domain-containing protein [Salinivirgaceae bacterium]